MDIGTRIICTPMHRTVLREDVKITLNGGAMLRASRFGHGTESRAYQRYNSRRIEGSGVQSLRTCPVGHSSNESNRTPWCGPRDPLNLCCLADWTTPVVANPRVGFLGLLNRYDVPAPCFFFVFPLKPRRVSRVSTLIYVDRSKLLDERVHRTDAPRNRFKEWETIRREIRIDRIGERCNTWCYISVG